jgi:hypothetical protein
MKDPYEIGKMQSTAAVYSVKSNCMVANATFLMVDDKKCQQIKK